MTKPHEARSDRECVDPIRILVVDDSENVRHSLRLFIESRSDFYLIGEAANGEEAVETCSRENPDLVMMDINMPVMTGIEATRIIKENHPDVQILAISAQHDPQKINQILEEGAEKYIGKNFKWKDLELAIEDTMVSRGN